MGATDPITALQEVSRCSTVTYSRTAGTERDVQHGGRDEGERSSTLGGRGLRR